MDDSAENGDSPVPEGVPTEEDVYELFLGRDRLVLGTADVAGAVGASREATERRLRDLADRGRLARQRVEDGTVWHLPGERPVLRDDDHDVVWTDDLPTAARKCNLAAVAGYGLAVVFSGISPNGAVSLTAAPRSVETVPLWVAWLVTYQVTALLAYGLLSGRLSSLRERWL